MLGSEPATVGTNVSCPLPKANFYSKTFMWRTGISYDPTPFEDVCPLSLACPRRRSYLSSRISWARIMGTPYVIYIYISQIYYLFDPVFLEMRTHTPKNKNKKHILQCRSLTYSVSGDDSDCVKRDET